MPYRVGSNTVITEGDAGTGGANGTFRNFFYEYSLNFFGLQGSNYGYITGGVNLLNNATTVAGAAVFTGYPAYYANPSNFVQNVERFPFYASVSSVQVGSALSTARAAFASQSSKTTGFNSGGYVATGSAPTPNTFYTNITGSTIVDSFPFTTQGLITVSSVGSLSAGRLGCAGMMSDLAGYTAGGGANSATTAVSTIDSFPFSAPFVTASSVGALSGTRIGMAGHMTPLSGYTSGGFNPFSFALNTNNSQGTTLSNLNRYPYASTPVTATNVTSLVAARGYNTGFSSISYGYSVGGQPTGAVGSTTSIERFLFSEQTITSAATPAVLSSGKICATGISSTEYGFYVGGFNQTAYNQNSIPGIPTQFSGIATAVIEKFPFTNTTTAMDTSLSLTTGKGHIGGNQY